MKTAFILTLSIGSLAFAQEAPQLRVQVAQSGAVGDVGFVTARAFGKVAEAPVQGAPYTATITNESIQTLADGNRIVQTSTGTMARDSLGRTRQDAPLPKIGNMTPANAPHLVFIQDPVAQASYTLNLTDKTAMKGPAMMPPPPGTAEAGGKVTVMRASGFATAGPPARALAIQFADTEKAPGNLTTEDLGSQTMEGVLVTGTRTTSTIPAGQIGNDKPISIVTEVWTSPELKTVVYSKRTDPRMGEQTFKLTNILRTEPDPTLFTVPSDFKVIDGQEPIIYHANQ